MKIAEPGHAGGNVRPVARRRGWGGSPPKDDEEAHRRIVATAVELIGRTGAAVSIADVADALGVIRQTVYRYFPSAESLLTAAAIASVDGFLDRLAAHVAGLDDPAEAMTEAALFTLADVRRTPHLAIVLTSSYSTIDPDSMTSVQAKSFGMTMIHRFDVDWERHGYDEPALEELVEFVLRTMHSFLVSPGNPPRGEDELRAYLRRWMGASISAQREFAAGTGALGR